MRTTVVTVATALRATDPADSSGQVSGQAVHTLATNRQMPRVRAKSEHSSSRYRHSVDMWVSLGWHEHPLTQGIGHTCTVGNPTDCTCQPSDTQIQRSVD